MDLSFINLPASQDELLGLLKVAYNAGQNSIGTYITSGEEPDACIAEKTVKYGFTRWLSQLATQWEDMKHS